MTAAATRLDDDDDDRTLAVRAAAGDEAAFTALYHRHVDAIYGRLTRLVGPTADRDDLLQQVWIQIHRALPGYREEAALATFLHRIAVHVAYDHLRARARRPVPIDQDAIDALVLDASSPAQRTQRRQELLQLFHHLAALGPDKRVAFVLVAIDGLPIRDAARLIGASPDAVKQRALQARRELTALIERSERAPRSTP